MADREDLLPGGHDDQHLAAADHHHHGRLIPHGCYSRIMRRLSCDEGAARDPGRASSLSDAAEVRVVGVACIYEFDTPNNVLFSEVEVPDGSAAHPHNAADAHNGSVFAD